MVDNKSLDVPIRIIAALLWDIQMSHGEVFTPRAYRLTLAKVRKRCAREGLGFLLKTLPRLGKALDRALLGEESLNSANLGFKTGTFGQLPKFMGELFQRIFSLDGRILPDPCVKCIKDIRQLAYLFYKYELPYDQETEQRVLAKFINTERDLCVEYPSLAALLEEGDLRDTGDSSVAPCIELFRKEGPTFGVNGRSNCDHCYYRAAVGPQLQFELGLGSLINCYVQAPSQSHKGREASSCNATANRHLGYAERVPVPGGHRIRGKRIFEHPERHGTRPAYPEQLTFQPWNAEWFNGR